MRDGEYVLGVDIGDETVAAAVCRSDGERWGAAEALWLGDGRPLGRAAVELAPDGSVRPVDPQGVPGVRTTKHVLARVGAAAPLHVGGRAIDAADVAAAIVTWVRDLAQAQEGREPARTLLAVPPSWGAHRRSLLLESLESACPDVGLVSSAVAATYHHATTAELPPGAVVAVYDMGASFLDTAVVGPGADGALHHLATPPAPLAWGGRDVDDALLGHLLRCLERPTDGTTQATARTCDGLRERAVAAKEALTVDTVVCVDLPAPTGPVRVTREELDELIDQRLEESVALMAATLGGAGLTAANLDGVVLAGGAVRMPLVAERLSAGLGVRVIVDPEPEFAVALGAAELAASGRPDATASSPRAQVAPVMTYGQDAADGKPGPQNGRLLEATRKGPAVPSHPGAARPARSPARRPPGGPLRTGRSGDRRLARTVLVALMFVGLVGVTSSLVAVVSDVRTAPAAQGQVAAAPISPAPAAPPEDAGVPPAGSAAAGDSLAETGSHRAAETPSLAQGIVRGGPAARSGTTATGTAPPPPDPVVVPQPTSGPPTSAPLTTAPPTTAPPTTDPLITAPPTTDPLDVPPSTDPPSTDPPSTDPPTGSTSEQPPPPDDTPTEPEATGDADPGTGGTAVDGSPTDGTTP